MKVNYIFSPPKKRMHFFLYSYILIYKSITITAEIEDERRMKNFPTFHGFAYSGESSDNDDPNEAYYYAGGFTTQLFIYSKQFQASTSESHLIIADSDREPKNW